MASPLLQLEHVTKRFGRVVIAEDLSLTVGPGETVGIVGPNGAGKTSLFGLISGDLSPGAGEIRFDHPVLPEFLDKLHLRGLQTKRGATDVLLRRYGSDVALNITRRHGHVPIVVLR